MKASVILFAVYLHLTFGQITSPPEFPYVASLEHNGKHICGSSIITRYELLTAAHCVHNVSKSELKVRLSTISRESDGFIDGIKDIHIHPNFNVNNNEDDIAILVLEHPLTNFIAPWKVKVAASGDVLEGKDAQIVGWGETRIGGMFSENLMYGRITTSDSANCSAHLKKPSDKILCSFPVKQSTCKGDGGGPLVIDDQLAGIITGEEPCAEPIKPMIFTKIPAYRDWIDNNILSTENLVSGFDSLIYWRNTGRNYESDL